MVLRMRKSAYLTYCLNCEVKKIDDWQRHNRAQSRASAGEGAGFILFYHVRPHCFLFIGLGSGFGQLCHDFRRIYSTLYS